MSSFFKSSISTDLDDRDLEILQKEVLQRLRVHEPGFRLIDQNSNGSRLKYGLTWRSYGEKITIEFFGGEIIITSRSRVPLQLVDWGKNEWNVKILRFYFQHVLEETQSHESLP